MSTQPGGPPPNKWTKVKTSNSDSDQVLVILNQQAQIAPPTVAVAARCSDGDFIFVGSYSD